ncbi:MAG: hypothetical protein ACYTAF_02080 [Planctomycetota bacterium]|jgi:hypothetical protein
MKKMLAIIAVPFVGAVLLFVLYAAQRDAPEPTVPKRVAPRESPPPAEPGTAQEVDGTDEERQEVLQKIAELEEELGRLQQRKDALEAKNVSLETLVKYSSGRAPVDRVESAALRRVQSVDSVAGLSEPQKENLKSLWTAWLREDDGDPREAAIWKTREAQMGSHLTVDQRKKLHDRHTKRMEQQWSSMHYYVCMTIGATDRREEVRKALGAFEPPAGEILLTEAHPEIREEMWRKAVELSLPLLTPDQRERLEKSADRVPFQ